jgi:hypothetical protein
MPNLQPTLPTAFNTLFNDKPTQASSTAFSSVVTFSSPFSFPVASELYVPNLPRSFDRDLFFRESNAGGLATPDSVTHLQRRPSYTAVRSPGLERARDAIATPLIVVIAEWDGYVEEVLEDYFTARMRGLKGEGVVGKNEEAEIPISDIDNADFDLIVPGGFFRLTISYETRRVGPKRRFTEVQFRRLPAFTPREIESAEQLANELFNGFQLDSGRQTSGT